MKKLIEDYFTLPRWERWGIITLVVINLVFIVWFFAAGDSEIPNNEKLKLEKNYSRLENKNSKTANRQSRLKNKKSKTNHFGTTQAEHNRSPEIKIAVFNPNTVTKQFLIAAGINKKLASRWEKYLSSGGKFKVPADVKKLYGMDIATYNRLLPYIIIPADTLHKSAHITYNKEIIDINTADTTMLDGLPGIGMGTAKKIISYRIALGGFHSLEQLKEIKSIRPENYDKMITRLQINNQHAKININTITEAELVKHPYFRKGIAGALVNYRIKHGDYKIHNDLLKCDLITPETLEKIKPYIVFE
jgi:DNA uptake protein ComE-like DNA-binding protein